MVQEQAKSGRRYRWLLWVGAALAVLLVALGLVVAVSLHRAESMLRAVIVEKLEDRFHARVELDSFHVSLVNGLWAEGKGLRIWPPGSKIPGSNLPSASNSPAPLIRLDEFRFHAPLHYDPNKPIRISVVQLKGLDVDVPPKTHFTHATTAQAAGGSVGKKEISAALLHFEVDSIECTGAHLTLETNKPGKMPLEFAIKQIKLTGINAGGPMHFDAVLTNPRPAGLIRTSGTVGPWAVDDPGETPLAGEYNFDHADLSVFKGIAGILDSTGNYQGVLRNITVDGVTETPDFRLTHFGTAVALHTRFHALVDATNGDTWLQPVDAVLGRSHFTAEGQVVRVPPEIVQGQTMKPGGHDIALKVSVDRGRMEDFLRLTSNSGTPLLTGNLTLKTTLDIPPGPEQVHKRIKLDGNFSLDGAEFTSAKIQDYVKQLSLRGQGDPKEAKRGASGAVRSAMQSNFTMVRGVIALPNLKYTVPGAEIDLAGKYGVEGSTLDFKGNAKMQATVSQMVGGWKGLLLKPADRFFKKDGAGTEIPIHIEGTRESPSFGVDLKSMKQTTHPAVPGQHE